MFTRLYQFLFGPTYKYEASFLMNSGQIINIPCNEITVHQDNKTNQLLSYELTGAASGSLYIKIADISAISYEKY